MTMESTLLVLTAAPEEARTASCLRLARTLRQAGKEVEVLLMQDAVLLPTQKSASGGSTFAEVLREGVRFLVLEDDLRLRGFGKDDLSESAQPTTYRAAIRRMAEAGTSVKGCF
ncbi:MAG: DsrE family protein [candidate division NC10 bacterium]|nr:DsrE family protein [candidate division NC10 bacterium]